MLLIVLCERFSFTYRVPGRIFQQCYYLLAQEIPKNAFLDTAGKGLLKYGTLLLPTTCLLTVTVSKLHTHTHERQRLTYGRIDGLTDSRSTTKTTSTTVKKKTTTMASTTATQQRWLQYSISKRICIEIDRGFDGLMDWWIRIGPSRSSYHLLSPGHFCFVLFLFCRCQVNYPITTCRYLSY